MVRAETDWCASASINVTYAKIVVDSVDVGSRYLCVRTTLGACVAAHVTVVMAGWAAL